MVSQKASSDYFTTCGLRNQKVYSFFYNLDPETDFQLDGMVHMTLSSPLGHKFFHSTKVSSFLNPKETTPLLEFYPKEAASRCRLRIPSSSFRNEAPSEMLSPALPTFICKIHKQQISSHIFNYEINFLLHGTVFFDLYDKDRKFIGTVDENVFLQLPANLQVEVAKKLPLKFKKAAYCKMDLLFSIKI